MNWILDRLSEPSTWAGLSALFGALSAAIPVTAPILVPAAAVASSLAVAMKEKGAR